MGLTYQTPIEPESYEKWRETIEKTFRGLTYQTLEKISMTPRWS